jgi:hypothetical protein
VALKVGVAHRLRAADAKGLHDAAKAIFLLIFSVMSPRLPAYIRGRIRENVPAHERIPASTSKCNGWLWIGRITAEQSARRGASRTSVDSLSM